MSVGQPSSDNERLPWLEPYREGGARVSATPRKSPPARPAQGRRWPLILLGGMLIAALVAATSFWLGRQTAPRPIPVATGPTVTIPIARVEPIPMPEVLGPVATEVVNRPAPPILDRPTPRRAERTAAPRPTARTTSRSVRKARPPRTRTPPIVATIARPGAGGAGQVIDLGRYLSPRKADAAWRKTIARYPYLAELPKVVAPTAQVAGRPLLYRLQIGARSPDDARTLCRNLISIGRPCTVM